DVSAETAARVAAEAVAGADDFAVAFRGRHRWVRGFQPVRAAAPGTPRQGDVFVLVGPLEARNGGLALALGRVEGVRIATITRGAPHPEQLRAMEDHGLDVLALTADSSDAASLGAALGEVEAAFGSLGTVIFSPDMSSVGEFAGISSWTPEWAAQLAAYEAEHGAMAAALEGRSFRRVLVDVTVSGVVGSVARVRMSAAHALSDGFAAAHRWTTVDWDHWTGGAAGVEGIVPDEVPAALDAVLALAGEPQVLVSVMDLEARIRAAAAPAAAEEGGAAAPLYERPELDVEYHAPTNEVEETLAELWQGLLGIQRVGIHDDFFGLGGHSLLATQIVARVREQFALDLPLQSIFEAPTIAKFAQLIEDAIIAELEGLSEEEAAGLMGQA
ncbi:MAG TPA: phosphopantetheine-binding protein, partial [Longimicrobium sp.]|nr:phosphopantetheine-binding protein [Longimicrobium sp.]